MIELYDVFSLKKSQETSGESYDLDAIRRQK